jgi:hypothetical protein
MQNDRPEIKIVEFEQARLWSLDALYYLIGDQYHNIVMRFIAFATCCNNFSVLL